LALYEVVCISIIKECNGTFYKENFKTLDSYKSFIIDLFSISILDSKEISSTDKESTILRLDQNIHSNNFRDKVVYNKKFKEIVQKMISFCSWH